MKFFSYANCGSCSLAKDGKPLNPVPGGSAAENPRIAFVLAAPMLGVGKTRDFFKQSLNQAGLEFDDVYVTYLLPCPSKRPQNRDDVASCSRRLLAELRSLSNLHVIVCMGSMAIQEFGGNPKDFLFHNNWSDRFKCHVVFSPSLPQVLNAPESYPDLKFVFQRVKLLSEPPLEPIPEPEVAYKVANNREQALKGLRFLGRQEELIAADFETEGLDTLDTRILDIGFGYAPNKAFILPWGLTSDGEVKQALKGLLESKNVRWCWHNGQFDVKLARREGIRARIDEDTMLLSYALDERKSHSLKRLSRKYFFAPQWEKEVNRYVSNGDWSGVPDDVRRKYLALDVYYTRFLAVKLHIDLANEERSEVSPIDGYYKIMIPAANALADIESRGLNVDTEYLDQFQEDEMESLRRTEQRIKEEVRRIVGSNWREFNPKSTYHVAKVIYDYLGCPNWSDEKKEGPRTYHEKGLGARSTSVVVLQDYLERYPSPFFELMLKHRRTHKRLSTYIEGTRKYLRKGRVHPQYRLTGTLTGRLSCSHPNVQNVMTDTDVKRMYGVPKGRLFVLADYDQLEVRVAAMLANDMKLAKDSTEDLHWAVTQDIFGPYVDSAISNKNNLRELESLLKNVKILKDVSQLHRQTPYPPEKLSSLILASLRKNSKYITFGVIYGRGAANLAKGELGCEVDEAKQYVDRFRKRYPDLYAWGQAQIQQAFGKGFVDVPSGRRRRFPLITPANQHDVATQAMNAPVQGYASDINTQAFVKLRYSLPEQRLGWPLFLVHDSIAFEIVGERLDDGVALIKETMENVVTHPEIRFTVSVSAGDNWGSLNV